MKTALQIIFCLFLVFSCEKKTEKTEKSNIKNTEEIKPILIKIGFYPSFHSPAETIVNIKDKYIIFYSPTPYSPEPPPPPRKNGTSNAETENEYKNYLMERPQIEPFKSNLTDNDLNLIQGIVKTFNSDDYNDKNAHPGIDGMSTNIIILKSDGNLFQINPLSNPKQKQKELYSEILNILIKKNTSKNNSIILQKIKEYQ